MEDSVEIVCLLHSLHHLCRNVSAVGMTEPEEKNGSFEAVSGIYGNRADRYMVPGEPAVSVAHGEEKAHSRDVSLCTVIAIACFF